VRLPSKSRETGTLVKNIATFRLRIDFRGASKTLGNQRADQLPSRETANRVARGSGRTTEGMSTGSGPNTCLQVPDPRCWNDFGCCQCLVPTACGAVPQVSRSLANNGILDRLSVEPVPTLGTKVRSGV